MHVVFRIQSSINAINLIQSHRKRVISGGFATIHTTLAGWTQTSIAKADRHLHGKAPPIPKVRFINAGDATTEPRSSHHCFSGIQVHILRGRRLA